MWVYSYKMKQKILQLSNKSDITSCKNSLNGRVALIVSAGPSAVFWDQVYQKLINQHQEVIVVSVKQAIYLTTDKTDFHFINWCNLENYSKFYKKYKNIFSIFLKDKNRSFLGNYDLIFNHLGNEVNDSENIASINTNFADFSIENTGVDRYPGPSIMLDSVLPFLEYCDVNQIYTIGWDIGGDEKHTYNEHFYKNTSEDKYIEKESTADFKKMLKKFKLFFFFKKLNNIKTQIFNIIKFYSGKRIYTEWNDASFNPKAGIDLTEPEIIKKGLPYLFEWLESSNIAIKVITNSNWFNEVESNRIKIERFLDI